MEGFVLLDTGAWSLVPPLLALALALITKEVYSSLLIGIVSGLLIYQFSLAGVGLEQTIDGLCLLPNIFIEQISANAGLILFCVGKGILFIYIFSCLYFFLTLCVLSPCIIMPSRQLLRQQLHLLGKRRILLHTDMPHILQQS